MKPHYSEAPADLQRAAEIYGSDHAIVPGVPRAVPALALLAKIRFWRSRGFRMALEDLDTPRTDECDALPETERSAFAHKFSIDLHEERKVIALREPAHEYWKWASGPSAEEEAQAYRARQAIAEREAEIQRRMRAKIEAELEAKAREREAQLRAEVEAELACEETSPPPDVPPDGPAEQPHPGPLPNPDDRDALPPPPEPKRRRRAA